MEKIDLEKIKEEIKTECMDHLGGKIATTSYCSDSKQDDNQDCTEEGNNSDGKSTITTSNACLTQEQVAEIPKYVMDNCIINAKAKNTFRLKNMECSVIHVTYPINTIEDNTIIVYLSSEDDDITEEMELLDEKFHFLDDFRRSRKRLGDLVIFDNNENYVLVGCIVKRFNEDQINMTFFQRCAAQIKRLNDKTYNFEFVALQTMRDDKSVNYKIINVLRNALRGVDIYVHWVGGVQQEISMITDKSSDPATAKNQESTESYYEQRNPTLQKSNGQTKYLYDCKFKKFNKNKFFLRRRKWISSHSTEDINTANPDQ